MRLVISKLRNGMIRYAHNQLYFLTKWRYEHPDISYEDLSGVQHTFNDIIHNSIINNIHDSMRGTLYKNYYYKINA